MNDSARIFILLAFLFVAASLVGCGGGEPLTLEEELTQMAHAECAEHGGLRYHSIAPIGKGGELVLATVACEDGRVRSVSPKR